MVVLILKASLGAPTRAADTGLGKPCMQGMRAFLTAVASIWRGRSGALATPFTQRQVAIEQPQPQENAALAAADGTVEAFERFFQRHNAEIVGYLWRMTCDEQAAYDLTQEVFVRAWSHFAEVSGYDRPRAWLFRVATNLALNHIRQRTAWSKLTSSMSSLLNPDVASPATDTLPNLGAVVSADHATEVAERDAIRSALLALGPGYRAALVLQAVYGMTCVEIAEALGVSLSGAKTRLARARARFRVRYLRNEQDDKDAADSLQQDSEEDEA